MCGIAGFIAPADHLVETDVLRRMGTDQCHRGPDDRGFATWSAGTGLVVGRDLTTPAAHMGIAHQRLAVIDPTEGGWQPMVSADGRFALAFNGEIYNYLELRRQLQDLGHRFRSESDTEVLVQAVLEWGLDVVLPRLVGMFAFALVDLQERAVHLVRDPFGIKPLHYAAWARGIAFASEIKTLRALPGVGREGDAAVALDYLVAGAVDGGEQTFFRGVKRLAPATVMTVPLDDPARPRFTTYWALDPMRSEDISFDHAAIRLRELFLESISLHLRSDVAVGAALSGGIDSASVVAAMREVGGKALDIRTVSFVARGSQLDEEHWADRVVRETGADGHKVLISPPELADDIEDLIRAQDEPFGSTSIYAQYRVFRAARELGITVMLDGQGADELLAGYPGYAATQWSSLMAGGHWARAGRMRRALADLNGSSGLGRSIGQRMTDRLPVLAAGAVRRVLTDTPPETWLNASWLRRNHLHPRRPRTPLHLRRHLLEDIRSRNLPGLLRYEDRNSMRFSIESRVPFLTPAIAEFVLALPPSYLVSDEGVGKHVFRAAMRGLTPDPILARRDKIGFATPESAWLLALKPWVDGILASVEPQAVPMLNVPALHRTWQSAVTGSPADLRHVWRWLNLIGWAGQHEVGWSS